MLHFAHRVLPSNRINLQHHSLQSVVSDKHQMSAEKVDGEALHMCLCYLQLTKAEVTINLSGGGVNRPIVCRHVGFATILDISYITPVIKYSVLATSRVPGRIGTAHLPR